MSKHDTGLSWGLFGSKKKKPRGGDRRPQRREPGEGKPTFDKVTTCESLMTENGACKKGEPECESAIRGRHCDGRGTGATEGREAQKEAGNSLD